MGICACDLVTHLGLSQPTISHHMRLLVEAHLVHSQKHGKWTHYTLNNVVFEDAAAWLGELVMPNKSTPITVIRNS